MKNLITIGLPSKGRLKEGSINFFEKNNLKLTSNGGERNYFAQIKNLPNSKIIYLHAKEIIQRLGDGTIDMGISGLDLLQESSINLQKKIEIKKKLNFGVADVVVAIPNDWIDVQTVADLEEVSFEQPKIFFPADHLIEETNLFNREIDLNQKHLDEDNIFIFGIKPNSPSSQYGYFLTKKISKGLNKVVKFIEKPDENNAKKIIKKKGYWNSGILFARKISIINWG